MKLFMSFLIVVTVLVTASCQTKPTSQATKVVSADHWSSHLPASIERVEKSEEEWKKELNEQEYYVIRKKGTERSFTGVELLNNKKEGLYTCKACGLPLFASDTKFKSGTGWPSYFAPLKAEYIKEDTDYNLGYARTEVMCAQCDGHLGHVFSDGPQPTGLRYCINAVSLDFQEAKPEAKKSGE